MDEPLIGRKLRVLIFSHEDNPSVTPLQTFLLQKGCPVRISYKVEELIDIAKKPNVDYGMIVVLSPIDQKIFKSLRSDRYSLLEFGPGRCSVSDLLRRVEEEAKVFGRY